jgi:hypothetical protein
MSTVEDSMARHPAGKGRATPPPTLTVVEHPALPPADNPTIPEVATVTVTKAVDGTRKRKPRSDKGKKRGPVHRTLTHQITVDPRVMKAAKEAMLPGQRLVIVNAECVRLVNS